MHITSSRTPSVTSQDEQTIVFETDVPAAGHVEQTSSSTLLVSEDEQSEDEQVPRSEESSHAREEGMARRHDHSSYQPNEPTLALPARLMASFDHVNTTSTNFPTPVYPTDDPLAIPPHWTPLGKFYTVTTGYRVGVFNSWDDVKKVTEGCENARQRRAPGSGQLAYDGACALYDQAVQDRKVERVRHRSEPPSSSQQPEEPPTYTEGIEQNDIDHMFTRLSLGPSSRNGIPAHLAPHAPVYPATRPPNCSPVDVFYLVTVGFRVGVFRGWDSTKAVTQGCPNTALKRIGRGTNGYEAARDAYNQAEHNGQVHQTRYLRM